LVFTVLIVQWLNDGLPGKVLYVSHDDGDHWSLVKIGDSNVNQIAQGEVNTSYVATDQGVGISTDGGQHWQLSTKGLNEKGVNEIYFIPRA
jgi:photosystem II stability/assembly factor-like uncharacterized protein